MNRYQDKYNPKRRIRECSADDLLELSALGAKVSYGGNPEHKRNPGDFGLCPPSSPRPAKSLCDAVCVYHRSEALDLLRKGIDLGLVSEQVNEHGFPRNIWSVVKMEGEKIVPLESQLENPVLGIYHGYPLPESDPMYSCVLKKWRQFQHG